MDVYDDPKAMQEAALAANATIALVPTMGNLHRGHQALIREGRRRGEILAVSIFVNPTQFGPNEDFKDYARTPEEDLRVCREAGVDWVFAPPAGKMYEEGSGVWIDVEELSGNLCGVSRAGHFRGVATVVLKLFNICHPNSAVFGWKDAQQFVLLRRMVAALNVPVEMVGVETVREDDGLAMSSRNRYLSLDERAEAPELFRALGLGRDAAMRDSGLRGEDLCAIVRRHIEENTSARIEYVSAVSMDDLEPVERIVSGNTLVALAAHLGRTRLIDNVRF